MNCVAGWWNKMAESILIPFFNEGSCQQRGNKKCVCLQIEPFLKCAIKIAVGKRTPFGTITMKLIEPNECVDHHFVSLDVNRTIPGHMDVYRVEMFTPVKKSTVYVFKTFRYSETDNDICIDSHYSWMSSDNLVPRSFDPENSYKIPHSMFYSDKIHDFGG